MSDTPRTDKVGKSYAHYIYPIQYDAMRDHAETLERELAAATARVAELEAADKEATDVIEIMRQQRNQAEENGFAEGCRHATQKLWAATNEATARAESAERDALMRAAEAIQGRISAHPIGSAAMVEAHKCKGAVLALIPKEKA